MKIVTLSRFSTAAFLSAIGIAFSGNALANCATITNFAISTPDAQFVDHGNGTVTHTNTATTGTGLMWKKCPQGRSGANCATGTATLHNWQQALREAVSDTTGTYTDWRLPSLIELMSIVETACRNPMINKTRFPLEFPQVQINAQYWTSTPGPAREAGQGWAVDFNRGSTALIDKTTSHYVRLVRLGKTTAANKTDGEDNYDRTGSISGGPSPLPTFTSQTGVNIHAMIESNTATLAGVTGTIPISVSGGEYRVTNTATVTFTNATDLVNWTSHNLTAGTILRFTNSGGALPTGLNTGVDYYVISANMTANAFQISTTSGGAALNFTTDGTGTHTAERPWTSVAGNVTGNQTIQVRVESAATPSTQKFATLSINNQIVTFSATTGTLDEPTSDGFISLNDLPTNTAITSITITMTNLTAPRSISVTGDASAQFKIVDASFATVRDWGSAATTILNGQRVSVRITTAGTSNTLRRASLWIFGREFPFSVTSSSGSATQPAAFIIPPKYDQPASTMIQSDPVVVTGISSSVSVSSFQKRVDGGTWGSCSATTTCGFRINGGAWVTTGSFSNNQTLEVQGLSGTNGQFTEVRMIIGSRDYYFNIDARAEPHDITLREQTLVPLGAWIYSNTVQVTGLLAPPKAISIASGEYRLSADGFAWGAWTSGAGTIGIDNYVQVRHTSAAAASAATTTTLTINTRAFTFKSTTGSALDVPSGLDFLQIYGAAPSSNVTSAVHTVAGLATSAAITVSGGAYQKNGAGGFVTSGGSVLSNDTIQMQVTTGACAFSGSTATLVANGYSFPFTVWTGAGPTLNPFSFPTRTNVCASAVTYSNFSPQLCSGWVGAVSIAGGTSPGYEKNDSGTYTATGGTVALYDKLRVRHTASATAGASVTTNLTVNGTVVPFTVTTRGAGASDPPAGSISFPTVQATASQVGVESAEAVVSLCTLRTPTIGISGGGATPQYAICSNEDSPCITWGGWTTSASVAIGGRAIKVRANAGGAGTTSTVTLTINAVPFTFQIQVP